MTRHARAYRRGAAGGPAHLLASAIVALATCVALGFCARPAAAQDARLETAETAILQFRYRPSVDTAFIALYHDDRFYLPLLELLDILAVRVAYDAGASRVHGFYIREQNDYTIDLASASALIGRRRLDLSRADFMIGELDVYVTPALLEAVFGMEVRVDARQLVVDVMSEDDLPVALNAQRARLRESLSGPDPHSAGGPLFPRGRRTAQPGVMDYMLSAAAMGSTTAADFRFAGGAELLGGSLSGEVRGGIRDDLDVTDGEATWRYVFDDGGWITQAALGRVQTNGLRRLDVLGAEVGNTPVRVRSRLGTYVVDGQTTPGLDVELLANGQTVALTRADETGRYRFTVPLSYGSTDLVVRHYGRHGEVREDETRIQIPFDFVPADTLEYSLAAGRIRDTDLFAAQAGLAYGVNDRLTNTVGVDFVSDSGSLVAYDRLTARLPGGLIAAGTVAPGAFYEGNTSIVFPSNAGFALSLTAYDGESLHNPLDLIWDGRASGFQPISVLGRHFAVRFGAVAREFRSGIDQLDLESEVRTTLGALRPFVSYSLRQQRYEGGTLKVLDSHELIAGVLTYMSGAGGLSGWLRGAMLQTSIAYDPANAEVRNIAFSLGRNLDPGLRVELGGRYDYRQERGRFELRGVWDHEYARSTTIARVSDNIDLTQSLSGTVAWTADPAGVLLSRRPAVGRAGAIIRTFVDLDADGTFDEGEPVVEHADLRFSQPVVRRDEQPGVLLLPDLLAYHRYTVDIDVSRVRNPMWVPAFERFSFELGPNWFRPIDVPFVVSGLVEGRVTRRVAGDERPVPGLRILLRSVDGARTISVPTFSDGVFYHLGVPPGRYVAEPDPGQLERLRLDALPARHEFEIRHSEEGDIIDGLEFELVPREVAPADAASSGEAPAPEREMEAGERGQQDE